MPDHFRGFLSFKNEAPVTTWLARGQRPFKGLQRCTCRSFPQKYIGLRSRVGWGIRTHERKLPVVFIVSKRSTRATRPVHARLVGFACHKGQLKRNKNAKDCVVRSGGVHSPASIWMVDTARIVVDSMNSWKRSTWATRPKRRRELVFSPYQSSPDSYLTKYVRLHGRAWVLFVYELEVHGPFTTRIVVNSLYQSACQPSPGFVCFVEAAQPEKNDRERASILRPLQEFWSS